MQGLKKVMADSPLTSPSASKTRKKHPQNEQLPAWHDRPSKKGTKDQLGEEEWWTETEKTKHKMQKTVGDRDGTVERSR